MHSQGFLTHTYVSHGPQSLWRKMLHTLIPVIKRSSKMSFIYLFGVWKVCHVNMIFFLFSFMGTWSCLHKLRWSCSAYQCHCKCFICHRDIMEACSSCGVSLLYLTDGMRKGSHLWEPYQEGYSIMSWFCMCRCRGETVNHLLIHCSAAAELWNFVFRSFGIQMWILLS